MSETQTRADDVLSIILGAEPGSKIDRLRNDRPNQIDELQAYYDAIFAPNRDSAAAFSAADRFAIAVRVAAHTRSEAVGRWYEARAREQGVGDDTIAQLKEIQREWPSNAAFDAAVRHADLVTRTPVEARAADLGALKAAGFSPAGIVSLSQVIAFVSYQARLVAGLRALEELA